MFRISLLCVALMMASCSSVKQTEEKKVAEPSVDVQAPVAVQPSVSIQPRYSFFTTEPQAEMVVSLKNVPDLKGLEVEISGPDTATVRSPAEKSPMRMGVNLIGLPDGVHKLNCALLRGGKALTEAETTFQKLPPKPNEVKVDNLSHGLIVNGRPFMPVGFYTSSFPFRGEILDGEVVNGFNYFSPYHGGPDGRRPWDIEMVKKYMDRCAEVGMRVNFHVMWAQDKLDMTDEQWVELRKIIETFRDHPALLSWYTADEPSRKQAEHLKKVYALLKELDPYHPVTMVFNEGSKTASRFVGALDIVMQDIYPVGLHWNWPYSPEVPSLIAERCDDLNKTFNYEKPLWQVPQAFGGGEWWTREPTPNEERMMAYVGLLHDSKGFQFFMRRQRVSFPKSPMLWGAVTQLAFELTELSPAILSVEKAPAVKVAPESVKAQAFLDRGMLTVVAVNTAESPRLMKIAVDGIGYAGDAEVMFENRKVAFNKGAIEEPIDAYGRRAYSIPVGPMPKEEVEVDPANVMINPSFEDMPTTGIHDPGYAAISGAATAFVDPHVARHGRHSLRMNMPTADEGVRFDFERLLAGEKEYRMSIWAKAKKDGVVIEFGPRTRRPRQNPPPPTPPTQPAGGSNSVSAANAPAAQPAGNQPQPPSTATAPTPAAAASSQPLATQPPSTAPAIQPPIASSTQPATSPPPSTPQQSAQAPQPQRPPQPPPEHLFTLTTEWKEYSFTFKSGPGDRNTRFGLSIRTPGTAWVDLLQVVPVKESEEQK